MKMIKKLFTNTAPTAKKTQHLTITETSWIMLVKETVAVYTENHTKPTNSVCRQNT
jgi:hypothetical protein